MRMVEAEMIMTEEKPMTKGRKAGERAYLPSVCIGVDPNIFLSCYLIAEVRRVVGML